MPLDAAVDAAPHLASPERPCPAGHTVPCVCVCVCVCVGARSCVRVAAVDGRGQGTGRAEAGSRAGPSRHLLPFP